MQTLRGCCYEYGGTHPATQCKRVGTKPPQRERGIWVSIGVESLTLKEARKRAGLSRARVAGQLVPPISPRTLQRWEDRNEIARDTRLRYRQLALIYEVDVRALAVEE